MGCADPKTMWAHTNGSRDKELSRLMHCCSASCGWARLQHDLIHSFTLQCEGSLADCIKFRSPGRTG